MDKQTEVDWDVFAKALEVEFSSDLIHCKDGYEHLYVKKQLRKQLPDLTEEKINEIMEQCCSTLPSPHTVSEFIYCLKKLVS